MESRVRTLIKALLWNVIGLMTMSLVGLVMTGSATVGGAMAAVNTLIGLTFYFLYERVWSRVRWGRAHG